MRPLVSSQWQEALIPRNEYNWHRLHSLIVYVAPPSPTFRSFMLWIFDFFSFIVELSLTSIFFSTNRFLTNFWGANFLLFSQKELVAGLHLCQTNTSGYRLTSERGWRSLPWPLKADMGAPTGWPAISWCSATAAGTGSSTDRRTASGYVSPQNAQSLRKRVRSTCMLLTNLLTYSEKQNL